MSTAVVAIYPGTFDPITLGHLDIIARGAALFGTIVVAVAAAHHKKTRFSLDERLSIVKKEVAHLPNVRVEAFAGLVTAFAVQCGAQVMLRGVRSVTDFDYETQLAAMNRVLQPSVDTVFLTPNARFQAISSTLVREIASLEGDVSPFVSPRVELLLRGKLAQ